MSDTIASSLLRKIKTFHPEPPICLIERCHLKNMAKKKPATNREELQTPRWTLWDLGSLYRFKTSSQREPSMPWSYHSLFAHLDCLESFGFGNAPGVGTDTCQLHSLRDAAQRIITAPYFGPRESFQGSENYWWHLTLIRSVESNLPYIHADMYIDIEIYPKKINTWWLGYTYTVYCSHPTPGPLVSEIPTAIDEVRTWGRPIGLTSQHVDGRNLQHRIMMHGTRPPPWRLGSPTLIHPELWRLALHEEYIQPIILESTWRGCECKKHPEESQSLKHTTLWHTSNPIPFLST